MRTFIAIILCYCGLIVIIATIIENRLQAPRLGTFNQRFKSIITFVAIGLAIFLLGVLVWPVNNG